MVSLNADMLGGLFLDMYLIIRFAPLRGFRAERGRELERMLKDYCIQKGRGLRTSAGSLLLFDLPASSGLRHEVDSGMKIGNSLLYSEYKAHVGAVPKTEVMVFNQKSLDYYFTYTLQNGTRPFFRVLISDSYIEQAVRRLCYMWSIITVEPQLVPIPVILRTIMRDSHCNLFEPPMRREAVRILPHACRSLNDMISPDLTKPGRFNLDMAFTLKKGNLDLIADVHQTLSNEILEQIESSIDPLYFESRADELLASLPSVREKLTHGYVGFDQANI